MCGAIPSPVCSLCNYQLDFISQENNNSFPQCVVENPDPAAVYEQSVISVLLLQCDSCSERDNWAAYVLYINASAVCTQFSPHII